MPVRWFRQNNVKALPSVLLFAIACDASEQTKAGSTALSGSMPSGAAGAYSMCGMGSPACSTAALTASPGAPSAATPSSSPVGAPGSTGDTALSSSVNPTPGVGSNPVNPGLGGTPNVPEPAASGGANFGGSPGVAGNLGSGVAGDFGFGGDVGAGGNSSLGGSPGAAGNPLAGGAASGGSPSGGAANGGNPGAAGSIAGGDEALLLPESGALLGGFIGAGTVESTEAQLGRSWAMQLQYFDWPFNFVSFASNEIQAGRIPYVTWEPWTVSLDAIASGLEDGTIQDRAQSIAALNGKVMLRFAHEMNGNWYSWGGANNGADAGASLKYIAAYRHIHEVFTNAGADNVLWVFCPNVDSVPNESWNAWENYYPGDDVVSWTCYDGYDWGGDSFTSMTSRIYASLAAKNKPILLGETSTQEVDKATWINAIIPALSGQFPMVRGIVWFHINKENDWRYDSTESSLNAFRAMANDPYFNP